MKQTLLWVLFRQHIVTDELWTGFYPPIPRRPLLSIARMWHLKYLGGEEGVTVELLVSFDEKTNTCIAYFMRLGIQKLTIQPLAGRT